MKNKYVQCNDDGDVYVDGKRTKLEKFVSKLEKAIRKGECDYFAKDDIGYRYCLLKHIYRYCDYKVDLNGDNSSDFRIEMDRLYKLANSEVMVKRNKKKWKDINTKPKYIFLRNLHESQDTTIGMFRFACPIGFGISMLVALIVAVTLGTIAGNPFMHMYDLAVIVKLFALTTLAVFLASDLYVLSRTTIKSIKEIKNVKKEQEKLKREEERVKIINKSKEKELARLKTNEVTRSKNVTKKYALVSDKEQHMVATFLRQRYRELEEKRNKLIISGASREQIEDVTNEMNAIVYKVNSMMGLDNSVHTSSGPISGPVRKLNK